MIPELVFLRDTASAFWRVNFMKKAGTRRESEGRYEAAITSKS
jgi:hypothetical protein